MSSSADDETNAETRYVGVPFTVILRSVEPDLVIEAQRSLYEETPSTGRGFPFRVIDNGREVEYRPFGQPQVQPVQPPLKE